MAPPAAYIIRLLPSVYHRPAPTLLLHCCCLLITFASLDHINPSLAQTTTSATISSAAFQNSFLQPHNQARAAVGVPPLSWDTALSSYAQSYAAQNAAQRGCQLVHSGGPYGENLFWGGAPGSYGGGDAVAAWVAEAVHYHYASNTCDANAVCGHYTQVVWRASTAIGCAIQACPGGPTFISCNYNPPGNYPNQLPY